MERAQAGEHTLAAARAAIFGRIWAHYRAQVAQVPLIEDALRAKGEVWSEDHVAFRTLPGAHCGAAVLQGLFEALGYERQDSLRFEDKKLNAFWLKPPVAPGAASADVSPKVFVSELSVQEFSVPFQRVIEKYASRVEASPIARVRELVAQLEKEGNVQTPDVAKSPEAIGKAWNDLVDVVACALTSTPSWGAATRGDYEVLRSESEYAAWTLLFGPRANHFTVSVHLMKGFSSLEEFNAYLAQALGVPMNASGGGVVKGGAHFRLAQSATLAHPQLVALQEGALAVPYAFVEFAFRFPLDGCSDDGAWNSYYQGFVVSNADRIFESTNARS
ncbi:MAG: DUF1338 domain-containing protein [Silvanigrellales bacterium]|jgi:hypothetical protein|nr:DUF1338 domain-containing protein [Silvanigrellales bacterium]